MLTNQKFAEIINALGIGLEKKILLALSGGIDSVVLANLMYESELDFEIAHVNYGLRGNESDEDEMFVRELASKYNKEIHVLPVNASHAFGNEKTAIQETARSIRYQWFESLMIERNCSLLFLAHHRDDQAETIVHRFLRGGGIRSFVGMRQVSGYKVRPLLNVSKSEIHDYAKQHDLKWRHDKSNDESIYIRNRIRHELMPMLQKFQPGLNEILAERSRLIWQTNDYLSRKLDEDLAGCFDDSSGLKLNLEALMSQAHPGLLLWHWLEPYGISSASMPEVERLIALHTGSRVEFAGYIVWRDHKTITLQLRDEQVESKTSIMHGPGDTTHFQNLHMCRVSASEVKFDRSNQSLFMDASLVVWPIEVRSWKIGDRFVPFGLQHEQKLSDFFTQKKISNRERSNYPVIVSSGKIIAIAGLRIDHNVRISEETTEILKIDFSI
jgi:tRNA(Ile)-lysidine synthase